MTTLLMPASPSLEWVPPSSGGLFSVSQLAEFVIWLTARKSVEPADEPQPHQNRDFVKLIAAQMSNHELQRCVLENPARRNTRARPCHRADSSWWAGD